MTTSAIRAELETKLKTWADAQSPVVPIAYENKSFTKPTTGLFLECFLMPAATISPTVKGVRKREVGLFQVNCWALKNAGTKDVAALSQSIVDLFPLVPKTLFTTVSIEKPPSIERGILDSSGWFIIPVLISYRAES